MPANELGAFAFVSWATSGRTGAPSVLGEKTEEITRPGTDGTGVRLLGRKAEPFQMISGVDVPSLADAVQLTQLYADLKGQPAQNLTWAGIDYSTLGVEYIVLDVGDFEIIPAQNPVGGFYGIAGGAYVRAYWLLQPVPI